MSNQKIRNTLNTLYEEVCNQGKAHLLPDLVAGILIEHKPIFPDGIEHVMEYIKKVGKLPVEVKRIAIEGDLAFAHLRTFFAGKEYAVVDILRFNEDGKMLEHWEVMQPVPKTSANENGMF
jgi:predicted SnoaL-like aldol condensation-catalyzing enzyme